MHQRKIALVIMAAGESARFRNGGICIKKQWLRSENLPLWERVARDLSALYDFAQIFITASKEDYFYMQNISDFNVVLGGDTRSQSLKNALKQVTSEFVLVSDTARFDIDSAVVQRLLSCIGENIKGAPLNKCLDSENFNSHTLDSEISNFYNATPFINVSDTAFYDAPDSQTYLQRENIKLIQTPQLSHTQTLRHALNQGDFTDESSAIYALGKKIHFVQGSKRLEKLTFCEDLQNLKSKLRAPDSEIFTASGFDTHAFENGKQMVLCGVKINSSFGFKAHSDGDVALHALADAFLGCIGAGDIGQWFPDSDDEFKGADSAKLLEQILKFAQSVGFEPFSADLTIIAQTPKINPYKSQMRQRLAQILNLPKNRVNIKASTTENLGFVGRKEGVAVMATASMKYINWHELI